VPSNQEEGGFKIVRMDWFVTIPAIAAGTLSGVVENCKKTIPKSQSYFEGVKRRTRCINFVFYRTF
jgi:hypothetical protein